MAGRPRGTAPTDGIAVDTTTIARGTRHTAVAQVITQVVRLATNVVLARLLTPEDFGVVAIALVVTMLLDQLKDLGTGSAIIQRQTVDDVLVNSVFYLNLALGIVLAGAMFLLAGPVAAAMSSVAATPVLQAFSLVTLITALGQIHHSLLRRDLRFFEIALATSVTAVVTAGVSIAGALVGMTYWALVVGNIAGALVGTAMVWVFDRWRPSWRFSWASLRSIWSYSFHLFLSNVLFVVFNQVDKVIVSRFLGPAALGAYTLAQRTVAAPVASVASVVNEVVFPVFSRRQDDHAALRSGFIRSSCATAVVTFPFAFGLSALAGPAVDVVFGERWQAVVPVLWFMAPVVAVQSVTLSSSQLLLAKGRSDWSYRWGVVYCVVLTALELYGVRWGLVGVTAAYAGGVLLLTPFSLLIAFRPVQLRLRTYFRALLPHLAISAVMVASVLLASRVTSQAGATPLVQLATGVAVGGVVYIVALVMVRPPALNDMLAVLRARKR
ncbi:MOP flippase family protein [Monashia sp. NPDC004114]